MDGWLSAVPSRSATVAEPGAFRARAARARALAARYRGEAAVILVEIAESFDAQAVRLEAATRGAAAR